ncbi:MAG: hypothetical protein JNJ83_22195 [Verrucomicrobiaceae bacterium]|nr:hypothetical protein [Verrucomicrobiaceae bacterium]
MTIPKLLSILVVLLSASLADAAPKIYGNSRYQFSNQGTMVTFGCGGINNPSKENSTGTIQVRLWATDTAYRGGSISGKVLGEYKLNGLKPGSYYSPVSKTIRAALPSKKKHYFVTLTVSEYRNGGYAITDYRTFDKQALIGPVDLFSLTGPWSFRYSTEGGTLDISVAKISHTRTGNTGTLKLAVWATDTPYKGGGIEGYQLGAVTKTALKPGYSYSAVKNTATFKKPPSGSYYITLVLSEYNGSEYRIVDHLNANNKQSF